MNTNNFNYNTWLQLSPLFRRLAVTITRTTSGKYKLTNNNVNNNEYFTLYECNIDLRVPFSALFSTNNKLDGIKGFNFSPALSCPSRRNGLCQLQDANLCYACQGEKRQGGVTRNATGKKGFLKMNSYYNSCLSSLFVQLAARNNVLLNQFIDYINRHISVIRFNKSGDFKNRQDIMFLSVLAINCKNTVFYGYTARDDLNPSFISDNVYLNGSNKMYTNRFKVTNNIKEYVNYNVICNGYCNGCHNCFSLKNSTILCFIHGRRDLIKPLINTADNVEYLNNILKQLDIGATVDPSTDIIKQTVLLISDKIGVTVSDYKINTLRYLIRGLKLE